MDSWTWRVPAVPFEALGGTGRPGRRASCREPLPQPGIFCQKPASKTGRYSESQVPSMPNPAAATPLTGPPATLIFNDWYPALRSEVLQGRRMVSTLLLGIPMVLGRREDGRLFAMRDLCPHRGIPLSCGWFDGKSLTCKYHGWVFEPVSGQCMEIPSLTKDDPFPHKLA